MKVGTRELKNRLSYYLKHLREDDPLFVTDRGTVIAEIRPVGPAESRRPSDREVLQSLAEKGVLTIGKGGTFGTFKAIKSRRRGTRLSRIVLEERR